MDVRFSSGRTLKVTAPLCCHAASGRQILDRRVTEPESSDASLVMTTQEFCGKTSIRHQNLMRLSRRRPAKLRAERISSLILTTGGRDMPRRPKGIRGGRRVFGTLTLPQACSVLDRGHPAGFDHGPGTHACCAGIGTTMRANRREYLVGSLRRT